MVYGYLYRLHPETVDEKNTFRPNEGEANQLLKYVWRNDSLIMVMPKDEMIGMCRANGNWTSYAEATYKAVMGKGVDDDRSTNIFDTYRYALINAWDKRPAAPLPPKLTAFQAYDPNPWGGPGGLQFTLSYYSSDFNYLDPSHLYYNLYIDDELVTFSPDDYQNLETERSDYAFRGRYHDPELNDFYYEDVYYKNCMVAADGSPIKYGKGWQCLWFHLLHQIDVG